MEQESHQGDILSQQTKIPKLSLHHGTAFNSFSINSMELFFLLTLLFYTFFSFFSARISS